MQKTNITTLKSLQKELLNSSDDIFTHEGNNVNLEELKMIFRLCIQYHKQKLNEQKQDSTRKNKYA